MSESGGPVTIANEAITGYYGLGEATQEFLKMLAIETRTLQPDEAEGFNFVGAFYIGVGQDVGGNLLVAFRPESPLIPSAGR